MIIDYDSPSGKAFVGKAKPPFIKAEGFGFQGVLLQTPDHALVQCHVCGQWFKRLFRHLETHKITSDEYRKKFGLFAANTLTADRTRALHAKAGIKSFSQWTQRPDFQANKHKSALKGRVMGSAISNSISKHRTEYQNKFGTCDAQLKSKLQEFLKTYFDLPPNYSQEGKSLKKTLARRFGSLNEAFKFYGLPTRVRVGTTVWLTFKDGEIYTYNYNRFGFDQRDVWDKLREKCQEFLTE